MGTRGPAPKRSDRKLGHTSKASKAGEGITKGERGDQVAPDASDAWHPIARQWFDSLAMSGQATLYESSDWALAAVLAESISRELHPQPVVVGKGAQSTVEMHELPMKGATLSAFLKGCTALLIAEADRRRSAVELSVPASGNAQQEGAGNVSNLDAWRTRTDGTG